MTYAPPVDDILFALKTVAGEEFNRIYDGLDFETIRAVLDEAARFAAEVLAPLNWAGDRAGCRLAAGSVTTPPGFQDAYRQYAAGGWTALSAPEAYGGQGLPHIVEMAAGEIWNGANVSFGLCPMLTQGAIHAIQSGGSEELKAKYLPKMIAGTWTGTMNLTEPHAGSDLSTLTTRALPNEDGSYRICGTKIFITFGEHDLAENIIHLVLARMPDAPPGTRGISLFLVPKFLVENDGSPGRRNDVICTGLEHKLGIMASPTCVMQFGDAGGATGYLVGEKNRGLNTMFVMMNAARLAVGLQGVGVAERATQKAVAYAHERRQGRSAGSTARASDAIIEHPDVRRMLLTMRALTSAARMICLATASDMDAAHRLGDTAAADRAALLTPVAKAFATDIACEVASLGVQVHGGMGFIEETGAAQYYRDARILPIYEGTNGIQAIDLVMRKLALGNGAAMAAHLDWIEAVADTASTSNRLGQTGRRLLVAHASLTEATAWINAQLKSNTDAALASATPYLRLFGLTTGGAYLTSGALAESDEASGNVMLTRFFADNVLTAAAGLGDTVMNGAQSILAVPAGRLAS